MGINELICKNKTRITPLIFIEFLEVIQENISFSLIIKDRFSLFVKSFYFKNKNLNSMCHLHLRLMLLKLPSQ